MKLIDEFKAFAVRGNVVDLAVAVIIGTAFAKIASSLVDTVVMPLIGLLIGGINFSTLSFKMGEATIAYGVFLQSVVDFVLIAFVIFMAIKVINRLKHEPVPAEAKSAEPSEEVKLLREIRDALQK